MTDADVRRLLADRALFRELLFETRALLREHLSAAYYKNELHMLAVFNRLNAALTKDAVIDDEDHEEE